MTRLESRRAAEDVLRFLRTSKASRDPTDPLTPSGFDATVLRLLGEMRRTLDPFRKRALDAMMQELGRDWARLPAEARTRSLDSAARKYLHISEGSTPRVEAVLRRSAEETMAATLEAAAGRHELRITPSLALVDQPAVAAVGRHGAHFIRAQDGRVSARLSTVAREVVADGLEEGLDRYAIADELARALRGTQARQDNAYLQVIASTYVARSRAYAELLSFEEAGIEVFRLEAVLDEVTTDVCRLLHGRTFEVRSALRRYAEVASLEDPEGVRDLQPWVRRGRDADGNRALVFGSRERPQVLARVEESGVGGLDRVGRYSNVMGASEMARSGIMTPPFHGHCRTLLVPTGGSFESVQVPIAVQPPQSIAPPAPPPPQAPPEVVPAGGPLPSIQRRPSAAVPRLGPPLEMVPAGEDALTAWNQFDAAVRVPSATLEGVFGGRVPTLRAIESAWGDGLDIVFRTTSVNGASPRPGEHDLSVSGGLFSKATKQRLSEGEVSRTFHRKGGKLVVKHDFQVLRPTAPRGAGARIMRRAIEAYTHLGVQEVEVFALWTGQYTWATFGFQWDAKAAGAIAERFEKFLVKHHVPHGIAKREAVLRSKEPWRVGSFDWKGITVRVEDEKVQGGHIDAHLGKAFLLQGNGWLGRIDLSSPESPSFKRVLARLFR